MVDHRKVMHEFREAPAQVHVHARTKKVRTCCLALEGRLEELEVLARNQRCVVLTL